MSDAVDNAEVMLYAVSEAYKESGNCRLEANYAHQQDVDMIPFRGPGRLQGERLVGSSARHEDVVSILWLRARR